MLTIPLKKLGYIVAKAREFDAEIPVDPDAAAGSNPVDENERQILLDTPDNPTRQELRDAIDSLNVDEREELLALTWLGRGDYDAGDWREALRHARGQDGAGNRISCRYAAARRLSRGGSRRTRPLARG